MSISNIQKRKFLETIYKIYYSLGSAPSNNEVSATYGRYFSRFNPSQPIPVPYNDLNTQSVINHDDLNRIMVHMLFNLDTIYENYYEQVEELYDVINAYNNRIESIKAKRAEIEKKVDDQLFSIKNTDGFYFSSTNAFNDTDLTDLNLTTAFVDTESRKVTIPKLTSGLFNYVANLFNSSSTGRVSVIFDGTEVYSNSQDISNVFNGLNNSQWQYVHRSGTIGLCTLKLVINVQSLDNPISLVEGKISSQKPVDIAVVLVNQRDTNQSQSFIKSQQYDYDRFSFNFTPESTGTVEIYLTKAEPDYATTENDQTIYHYDFRIDELIITAPYYDTTGIFVGSPVSLPSQNNSKLVIDAVSLTVNDQVPNETDIVYYIAEDNPGASSINDFNWKPISPTNLRNPNSPTVVSFLGSDRIIANLFSTDSDNISSTKSQMRIIPRTIQYNNPISNYFYQNDSSVLGFNVYRLAKFSQDVKPYESYILENVDENQLTVSIAYGSSLDKQTWQDIVTKQRTDIVYSSTSSTIRNVSTLFEASNINYGSIRLSFNVFADNNIEITDEFLKSLAAQYWDVRVYLNGSEITAPGSLLGPGSLSSNLTWRFKKGPNDVIIIINKSTNNTSGVETSFNGSISLFKNRNLLSIPGLTVFKNYLYEVKIEDLRSFYSNSDNVYSIIKYENSNEIVYRRMEPIVGGSKVYYYTNNENSVNSIRVRADLFRGRSVYSSPAINSYTLKFKH